MSFLSLVYSSDKKEDWRKLQTIFFLFGNLPGVVHDVLKYKYLLSDNKRCGYISGLMFFNQLGLSTQLPMVYEVVSNKATKDYRETKLGSARVVVRRPRVTVTEANYKILQFLDIFRDIDRYSEVTGDSLKEKLYRYMDKAGLTVSEMKPYFSYYPDKLYKNLVETEVIFYDCRNLTRRNELKTN